jgi:hypothetical protein
MNQYNQPDDSPVANHRSQIRGVDFDVNNDNGIVNSLKIKDASITTAKIADAAITSAKIGTAAIGTANIGTLSFSQISGGTAALGGTTNGDGILTVSNAGGTEVVRLDNTGITMTAGTLTGITVVTTTIQSGSINNAVVGTPAISAGTYNGGIFGTPSFTGTPTFPVLAGSAALGANGNLAIQTFGTAGVLAIRVGGTTFYFNPTGTLT